ncbi:MAG: undecaprenyl-diphosphate phosphatase [Actinobacteria bacterium]|nr:undecaprenyl-diphosphate phosphatase [Actinomycetota bacterium]
MLGITQGVTEFAPVSSSGHLILVPWLFGWHIVDNPDLNKTFDVALHVGTLLGALVYFWKDVWKYLRAWLRSIRSRRIQTVDERLAWALVIGTIPGGAAGALFEEVIQKKLGQPWLIAVMLAAFGVVLLVVDRRAKSDLTMADLTVGRGLTLGVAQALALQPGVSRSGITMTVARAMGLDRESATRFSFLLALPIIAGAGLLKGIHLVNGGFHGYASQFLWGFLSSAASGFVVIWGLLAYLRRHDYKYFMIYRLAVAAIVLVVIAAGVPGASGI